jgi:hypothetical protein
MIKGPIKYFNDWKLFESEQGDQPVQPVDPNSAASILASVKAEDERTGVSTVPGYDAVMKWWSDGHGQSTFWASFIKSHAESKYDKIHSLSSAKYWAGQGSNPQAEQKFNSFIKVVDALIAKKADPTLAPYQFLNDLVEVKRQLEEKRKAGVLISQYSGEFGKFIPAYFMSQPGGNVDPIVQTIQNGTAQDQKYMQYVALIKNFQARINAKQSPPLTQALSELTAKFQKGPGEFAKWTTSTTISSEEKKQLLASISQKATAYLERMQKYSPESKITNLNSAILAATDLSIAPNGDNITIMPAAKPVITTSIVTGQYPAVPIVDGAFDSHSEEMTKAKALFQDNVAVLKPESISAIQQSVDEAVKLITEQGGKIKNVTLFGAASTSKVPTQSYAGGNKKLTTDRFNALIEAFKKAFEGKAEAITVDSSRSKITPEQGPDWNDQARAKYMPNGQKTPEYETTFGPYRYAIGYFEIQYVIETQEEKTFEPSVLAVGKWKALIGWRGEGIKLRIPPILTIKLRNGSTPSVPGKCSPW